MISFRAAVVALLCMLLVACAAERKPVTPTGRLAPEKFPEELYLQTSRGEPVYRIDPDTSRVLIYVYRDGPLAKLGHDHVIASHGVRGYALLPNALADARTDIFIPVATLTVDEPGLRRDAGFETDISVDDIESTRRRMLQVVLGAEQYPYIQIHATVNATGLRDIRLNAALTLHGVTHVRSIPVRFTSDGAAFHARGEADVSQSSFGITPFSILGGALAVKDRLHVTFRIEGTRVDPHN